MKVTIKKFICLVSVLLLVSGFMGCSKVLQQVEKKVNENVTEKIVKGSDGKTQITVHSDWKEEKELNAAANIQVANRVQEKYAVVISESTADFSKDIKVGEFADLMKNNMVQNITDASVTDMTDMTINGMPAKYFEIQGEVNKIKVKYLIAAVKGKAGLHQIITWTLNSKYDQNKEELKKAIQSFMEI